MRLEIDVRAQRTRVTDPLSGAPRRMSNERDIRYDIQLVHPIAAWRTTYGAGVEGRTAESYFGLDELETDKAESKCLLLSSTRCART